MKRRIKKQPATIAGIAEIRFEFRCPGIDPDIAKNAILARFKQKLKERPGTNTPIKIEEIAEDLFLASLSNTPAETWSDDTWKAIQERVQSSPVGKSFWERLKKKRVPEFTPDDVFMLKRWLRLDSSMPPFDELPGLQKWRPSAAMALMKLEGYFVGASQKWYEDRRLNLGLIPSKKYFVLDAGTHLTLDGQWAVRTAN